MIDINSKTYCPLIFHGIYVERTTADYYQLSPCCMADKDVRSNQPINFTHNKHLNTIRGLSLSGQRAPQCRSCWAIEDIGGESKRQVAVDYYRNNQIDQTPDVPKLMSLEYNTLPICNAKCIICGPHFSSAWIHDARLLEFDSIDTIVDIDKQQNQLTGLELGHIKNIYFNGGEPLLTNDHVAVLTQLQNIADVAISYNTNGSCYPTDDVLQLWSKAKEVTLSFSIDGITEQFEYIRNPLIWAQVSNNIIKLNNCLPNLKINVAYTVGLHNIFGLRECIDWFSTNIDNFDSTRQFHVHTVNGELDIKYAGAHLRQSYLDELALLDTDKFYWATSLRNYISSTVEPSDDWMDYLSSLDKIRNTNWETTFVKLYDNNNRFT